MINCFNASNFYPRKKIISNICAHTLAGRQVVYCMGIRVGRAVAAALAAAALIIIASAVAAAPSCVSRAAFSVRYHFVCYKSADDAHTAASVSSVVQSHGGAGYIVKTGDDYRVAAGCYYSAEDARKVCSALSDSGLACDAVEAGVDGYDLPRDLAPHADAVLGAIRTLDQLGRIFYGAANGLDGGTMTADAALSLIADARSAAAAVAAGQRENALGEEAAYLVALMDDIGSARVTAREVRALQVAVCDAVLNVRFV